MSAHFTLRSQFPRNMRYLLATSTLSALLLGAREPAQKNDPATPPATAPVQQAEPAQTLPLPVAPTLKITTRMVLVDAVVTDGSGKAVHDLKPGDFVVLENGKPQAVRAFGERRPQPEPPTGTGAGKPASRVLSPGFFTNIPDYHPEDGPPTILLVDALNTQLQDQPYMTKQLLKFLKTVGSRRNVAIYTLGSRLRLVQDFTADPKVLEEALKKVEMHESVLSSDSSDNMVNNLQDSGASAQMVQSLQEFQAEEDAFKMDIRVRVTTEALQQLGRNVAGINGRKNLVWLSGSFPFYVSPDTESSTSFITQRSYAKEIQEAAIVLTDSQVAVYPVDARGLVGTFPDASTRLTGHNARGPEMARTLSRASDALLAAHASMNEIAEQTGGRAFYNRNDIDHAVAMSVEDGSSFYTLGYYPQDKSWDGKFRKIEVKANQKGLHVRHRRGYFATGAAAGAPADAQASLREFAEALAFEAPAASRVPFIARVIAPSKDQTDVIIEFSVDPRAIYFDSQADNRAHAKVDFVTTAYNAKGKVINSKTDTMTAALKPATYQTIMSSKLSYRLNINLPPGKYVLKLGVRDQGNNVIGTASASVEIPPAS